LDDNVKIILNQCGQRHLKPKYYRCQIGYKVSWCSEGCDRRGTEFCAIKIMESGQKLVEVEIGKCQRHANLQPALAQVTEAVESLPDLRLGSDVISKLIVFCQNHGLLGAVKASLSAEELDFLSRRGFDLG
jgi:hypothetical protein